MFLQLADDSWLRMCQTWTPSLGRSPQQRIISVIGGRLSLQIDRGGQSAEAPDKEQRRPDGLNTLPRMGRSDAGGEARTLYAI